ncbi:MAG: hypothetical protein IJ339_03110 [Oscillospiraceae bacterium]|nr:hypothetical protein [Oscillospiraceae bacterium]
MLKILAVIGWILLFLLALIVWVIVVPRSVFVEYTAAKGPVVKVRVFLFKIKVYPLPAVFAKKEKPKADKNKSTAEKQSSAGDTKKVKKQKSALADFMADMPKGFELVKEVLATVKGVMAILLKGIYIKDVSFTLPVNGKTAEDTQKQYALVTNSFYSLNIFLQKYVKIFYKKPIFVADFANLYKDSTYFYCKIQASPSIILVVGWYLFKTYRRLTKNKPKEK